MLSPEQFALIETLYMAHYTQLLRYAMSVVQNSHQAEELVQDTFHEAVNHIDKVMAHPAPKNWLRQTLKYKIKNSERKRLRDLRHILPLDIAEMEHLADSSQLEKQVMETLSPAPTVVERIQGHLSQEEFHHLKRLTLENASHLEVSQKLGITVWASQKRLERIRKKLRQLLSEN